MTHTDTRPTFDCKYCHKVKKSSKRSIFNSLFIIVRFIFLQKFVSKRGLWDHETIHTGAKPYFCHLCPAKVILRLDQSSIKNIVQYRFAVSQKYLRF